MNETAPIMAQRDNVYGTSILSYVLNKKVFLWALCFASILPFTIGTLHYYEAIGYLTITAFITFLATVHVPITLYLFSDSRIRSQAMAKPLAMMITPCVIISVSIFMFLQFSVSLGSDAPQVLFFFMYAVLSWQNWHFGKQNVGVFAFALLATQGAPMRKIERTLIVAGSFCGVMAVSVTLGPSFKNQYMPGMEFSAFDDSMATLFSIARYVQYLVTAISLAYVIVNSRSLTLPTRLLFLIGVNFFLPSYIMNDLPDLAFLFLHWGFGHGLQYFVFLFFHSLGMADIETKKSALTEAQALLRLKRIGHICMAPAVFAIAVFIFGDLYSSGRFLSFSGVVGGGLNSILGLGIGATTVSAVVSGLMTGILATHFWLDTFLWRLKDKAPREWAMSRYHFLFKN